MPRKRQRVLDTGALRRSVLAPPMVNGPKKATLTIDGLKIDMFITEITFDRSDAIIDITEAGDSWCKLFDTGAPTKISLQGEMIHAAPPDAPKPPAKKPSGYLEDDPPIDKPEREVCPNCECRNCMCDDAAC